MANTSAPTFAELREGRCSCEDLPPRLFRCLRDGDFSLRVLSRMELRRRQILWHGYPTTAPRGRRIGARLTRPGAEGPASRYSVRFVNRRFCHRTSPTALLSS